MREYLEIGPVPANEECQPAGHKPDLARRECNAYVNQLRRELGPEPEGARLAVKTFRHDFGSYQEVVCYYDSSIPASVEYAFRCESDASCEWDDEAKAELQLAC